jgi:hypothetical protein
MTITLRQFVELMEPFEGGNNLDTSNLLDWQLPTGDKLRGSDAFDLRSSIAMMECYISMQQSYVTMMEKVSSINEERKLRDHTDVDTSRIERHG